MTEHQLLPAFGWLCVVTALSWSAPPRWQPLAIALGGACLLAWYSPLSLAVLAACGLISFGVARLKRRRGAAVGLTILLLVAAYALLMWRAQDRGGLAVVLPLGMAYYVLRTIHYLVEAHLGRLRPHGLLDYAAYQLTPSSLLFGPIHRFDVFQRDLARRRWDAVLFSSGLGRILAGAFKVVVIGNFVVVGQLGYSPATDLLAGGPWDIYRHSLLFWANLYVQFSGYSDVAVGFAALMGFRITENFNWPLLSRNIGDFWRRWHISLSTWCRDYIYMPAMARTRSHLVAIIASMTALGLWHALSIHYLLWGLYHALGLAVWRRFNAATQPTIDRWPVPVRQAWTVASVFLTLNFVLFSFAATTLVERFLKEI
jgi:alginate O-acetyltransferase complex protein AlgI